MVTLLGAALHRPQTNFFSRIRHQWSRLRSPTPKQSVKLFLLVVSVFYFVSVWWNYSTAPWNHNGLFDDAAWDIYFSKRYIFANEPFQPAFWDHGVSREVGFHYYLTVFFELFGYNTFSYILGLVLLGYINYISTILLAQLLFKNTYITGVLAIVMQTLPFHFIYIFVGHRYAMAAPLMMLSLFLLYKGFYQQSHRWLVLSGIVAGLCMQSAIMGKHYLLVLIISAMLLGVWLRRKVTYSSKILRLAGVFVMSLLITITPLIAYAVFNEEYFIREKGLSAQFSEAIRNGNTQLLWEYGQRLYHVFFTVGPQAHRWFIPGFLPLPIMYMPLVVVGSLYALWKKNLPVLGLATLPIVGAYVSQASDFRFLHALPSWILLIGYALELIVVQSRSVLPRRNWIILTTITIAVLLIGSLNGARYIHAMSKDPNSLHLFGQKDVAVARYIKDILEEKSPSSTIESNEFSRNGAKVLDKRYFICLETGYAVPHMYVQNYDDVELFDFCSQLPLGVVSDSEIYQSVTASLQRQYVEEESFILLYQQNTKLDWLDRALKDFLDVESYQIHTLNTPGGSSYLVEANISWLDIPQILEEL